MKIGDFLTTEQAEKAILQGLAVAYRTGGSPNCRSNWSDVFDITMLHSLINEDKLAQDEDRYSALELALIVDYFDD